MFFLSSASTGYLVILDFMKMRQPLKFCMFECNEFRISGAVFSIFNKILESLVSEDKQERKNTEQFAYINNRQIIFSARMPE